MPNRENSDSASKTSFWSFKCRCDPDLGRKLDWIVTALNTIQRRLYGMAGELAQLQADVAAERTVVDSAIVLLNGLAAKLDEAIANNNPQALADLSTEVKAQTQALADAVTANTRP